MHAGFSKSSQSEVMLLSIQWESGKKHSKIIRRCCSLNEHSSNNKGRYSQTFDKQGHTFASHK